MADADHPERDTEPDEAPSQAGPPPDETENDDDSSDAAEHEADDSDDESRTIHLDDIKRRAHEKYDHLPPEERDAAAAKDLQDSIDRVYRATGASLTPISEWQRGYTRRMAEALSSSMPKIDFSVLSNAIDTSSIKKMAGPLAAIAPTFSVFDDEQIAGMMKAMQSSLQSVETEQETGSQEHEDDDDDVATEEASVSEQTRRDEHDATDHDAVLDWAAAFLQLQESLNEQVTATWRVLDTLADQSESIHKTADAMLVQLEQTERQLQNTETMLQQTQEQLQHAKTQSEVQAEQHDEVMGANKRALGFAAGSAIAATAAVLISIFGPTPTLEIPEGHMLVPEDHTTVGDSQNGEAGEGDDDEL